MPFVLPFLRALLRGFRLVLRVGGIQVLGFRV